MMHGSLVVLVVVVFTCNALHSHALSVRHTNIIRKNTLVTQYKPRIRHTSLPLSSSSSSIFPTGDDDEIDPLYQDFSDYESIDSSLSDDDAIGEMRLDKMLANDRWQSCHFRDNQGTDWNGTYETYLVVKKLNSNNDNVVSFKRADTGMVRTTIQATPFTMDGVGINIDEQYKSTLAPASASAPLDDNVIHLIKQLQTSTRNTYTSTDFRILGGNQAVANAFTLCTTIPAAPLRDALVVTSYEDFSFVPNIYTSEVGIREGPIRTRVRYLYAKKVTEALYPDEDKQYLLSLAGFTIIREAVLDALATDVQPLFDSKVGPGIYDIFHTGEPYVQLNVPGRLSLLFPRGLTTGIKQCMTMEIEGKLMRYQADRKIIDLTGTITGLELTEVETEIAKIYPAGF